MFRLYDTVKIKSTGEAATIIEIDENRRKSLPIYLVELNDKPKNTTVADVIKWLEQDEIENY